MVSSARRVTLSTRGWKMSRSAATVQRTHDEYIDHSARATFTSATHITFAAGIDVVCATSSTRIRT